MAKFSYPLFLIAAILLARIPQFSGQSMSPEAAPAPAIDCMPYIFDVSDCLSFVTPGSNLTRPDPGCCTELATLVNEQPICLCQLLGNSTADPVPIDVQRGLQLPSVCNVTTPPPSACAVFGFLIPPSPSPEVAPMSHAPAYPDWYIPSGPPAPDAYQRPYVNRLSPLVVASQRNRMKLGLGLGVGIPVLLVSIGISVFFLKKRKNTINRPELESPSRGVKDKDGHSYHSPTHLLQNYPGSPNIDVVGELPKPTILPRIPLIYPVDQVPAVALSYNMNAERQVQQSSPHTISSNRKTRFTYEELFVATNNFSQDNLLGEGGFGNVHKGVLIDGKEVAVKQLKVDSRQGEREFQAEVDTVSRVHHRHLVSLVGYCISGAKRLLVYEFVPNDTLDFHLHGAGRPPMSWETRMKIALGCAKGLAYLHEDCQPKIIHRDIKSCNILLNENFEAKVADFGLARFYLDNETHISTRVMGTFGYLAPEYALTGHITEKSDVFSFGVVLLELITGRRPIDKTNAYHDGHIINWARPLLKEALANNNFDSVLDPRLHKNYDSIEIARVITCASACVNHLARCRPSMSQVVCVFEGVLSLDDLE